MVSSEHMKRIEFDWTGQSDVVAARHGGCKSIRPLTWTASTYRSYIGHVAPYPVYPVPDLR